jgi:hypothetical protein
MFKYAPAHGLPSMSGHVILNTFNSAATASRRSSLGTMGL